VKQLLTLPSTSFTVRQYSRRCLGLRMRRGRPQNRSRNIVNRRRGLGCLDISRTDFAFFDFSNQQFDCFLKSCFSKINMANILGQTNHLHIVNDNW
jgi:hypothetical protein